jgi:biopolymer transport protein ExbD
MSHGSDHSAVPNLTPLLDVVLQLLMFFMMCVNFVSGQVTDNVTLPMAQAARPITGPEATSVLFLNLDRNGDLVLPGQVLVNTPGGKRFYLKQQFRDAERVGKGKGSQVSIVIRADEGADYGKIFEMLSMCKEVGFRKLQLRALQIAV